MPGYEITPKSECSLTEMKTIPWNQNVYCICCWFNGFICIFICVCVCSSEIHVFMEITKIWHLHQNIYGVKIHQVAKKKSKASSMYELLLIFIKCILSLWFSESCLVLISLALTIIITGEIQNTKSTLSLSNDLDISNSMTQVWCRKPEWNNM